MQQAALCAGKIKMQLSCRSVFTIWKQQKNSALKNYFPLHTARAEHVKNAF